MLNIGRFTVENLAEGCVTDVKQPRFSFALDSDRENAALKKAVLRVGDWQTETGGQIAIPYDGPVLKPFTTYTATITAEDDGGEKAEDRYFAPGFIFYHTRPAISSNIPKQ